MSGGPSIDRRWLGRAFAFAGAAALAACDQLNRQAGVRRTVDSAEGLTRRVQRLILSPGQLAPEFEAKDISPIFRPNGSTHIADPAYQAQLASGFADWRLEIGGLVERPLSLSLADLRTRPGRTQITRHDCVEGWSCIGQWTGARLGPLLSEAVLKPAARFIVFFCADLIDPSRQARYYESIGLADAFHPQTILAYEMNGAPLSEPHGAPIRLRVERQLGYKQAKYIMRIAAVDSLAPINGGRGGYWEDSAGYEWYGGV
jgi:DMSO/TMAO reductase YedYZ molybdopterin-dependent catalytic subunit